MYQLDENKTEALLERDIYPVLTARISSILKEVSLNDIRDIEEIRLRADKPVMISSSGRDYFLTMDGRVSSICNKPFVIDRNELEKTLQFMCNYSIYSVEEELKQGFLTLRGGHRVGLCGRIVMEANKIRTMKNVSGINIRIAREVKGCAGNLVKSLYGDGIKHTLIASPPGCGKTTLLRDIIRILSWGENTLSKRGYKIGVVDERSEIAGCFMGVPQRDVGVRTDVLDACPKAQGMMMLLRSMSPEIIAVDEIGSIEDSEAIENAINSGVKVIATAHGRNLEEVSKKQGVRNLIDNKSFERIIILNRKNGPGTIDEIIEIK